MQDIELLSQTGCALLSGSARRAVTQGLQAGVAIDWLNGEIATELARTYRLCWQVQLAAKLLSGQTIDPDQIGEGGRAFLLRETGAEDIDAQRAQLTDACEAAATMISAALTDTSKIAK